MLLKLKFCDHKHYTRDRAVDSEIYLHSIVFDDIIISGKFRS